MNQRSADVVMSNDKIEEERGRENEVLKWVSEIRKEIIEAENEREGFVRMREKIDSEKCEERFG